jgi:anthranilate phosphoribosyltransferase
MKDVLPKLIAGENLKRAEAFGAMTAIMKGEATPSQIAGFLVALRAKGETPEEIAGCALAMRDAATPLALQSKQIVDTCGTGGDGKSSLNVSTAAAFVVAGAGLTVAKHGNRGISSKCGSADVLEVMGVRIDAPVAAVEACLNHNGIGFLFAPNFHPAMRFAMPTRKELGVRTVFNVLGPLTNPARARVQMIGVFHRPLLKPLAQVMAQMGHIAGLVVHSNGWDEITLDQRTHVAEVFKGKVRTYSWTHRNFGLPKVASKHLKGGDAETNAGIIRRILSGERHPARDVIVANAAAVLWIAERGYAGKTIDLKDAVARANRSIDSGAALARLKGLVDTSTMLEP